MLSQNQFLDLNSICAKQKHGIISIDKSKMYEEDTNYLDHYNFENQEFFLKPSSSAKNSVPPIATSKLFNECGIISPPIFLVKPSDSKTTRVFEATQNIKQITDVVLARKLKGLINEKLCIVSKQNPYNFDFLNDGNTWKIFLNDNYKQLFLQFMTEECFNQYINLFLIDELRTELDRHTSNFFLYKTNNAQKFEGIIVIDSDRTAILGHDIKTLDDFEFFLGIQYYAYTPLFCESSNNYISRSENIRNLLQKGLLSKENLLALKTAINFDFPEEIKKTAKKFKLSSQQINEIYNPIAYLWDYNRKTLGKELEL